MDNAAIPRGWPWTSFTKSLSVACSPKTDRVVFVCKTKTHYFYYYSTTVYFYWSDRPTHASWCWCVNRWRRYKLSTSTTTTNDVKFGQRLDRTSGFDWPLVACAAPTQARSEYRPIYSHSQAPYSPLHRTKIEPAAASVRVAASRSI